MPRHTGGDYAPVSSSAVPSSPAITLIRVSRSQRHCLFCGHPRTSREHILARWIGRSLTGLVPPGLTIQFAHESAEPDGTPRRTKRAKGTAYFTRAFCRDECNGGWMSRLEDAVKPVLEPMLHGRLPTTLSVADQQLLAFWATKTAFAFQTQEGRETTWARPEDFRALYAEQGPLAESQVWLGAREVGHAAFYRGHSVRLGDSDRAAVDGFGVVLTVGFAVFWVLVPYLPGVGLRLTGEAAMATKPIWPGLGRPVVWPPAHTIVPLDLTGLPARFAASSRLLRTS